MIPLKLQLHNFMCYRDPDALDFSGIRLACLAGKVGSGKSTLLDAMTWVLWGKTLSTFQTSVRDDELIYGFGGHLAQTEMEVEFEFALGENHYRVIRKRDSRGRGQSSLELQVRDDDLFRPLTKPTMRKTQAHINRILRMDYETAINSAFLLQGRADEFTTADPADRKRTFGNIIGLSLWVQSEKAAKKRADAAAKTLEQVAAQILLIEQELERKSEYEDELRQAQDDVKNLNATLRAAEDELGKLREDRKALALKQTQIQELSSRLAQGERELAEITEQMATCRDRLAEYDAVISDRKAIEDGFASLTAARQLHDAANQKLAQLVQLKDRKGPLEATIAEAKHALALEQRLCSEKVGELSALAQDEGGVRANLINIRAELEGFARGQSEWEAKQQEIAELSNENASLKAQQKQLGDEVDSLKKKRELLGLAEADCPLCGQGLSDADRVRLVERFSAEIGQNHTLFRTNATTLVAQVTQLSALQQESEAVKARLSAKGAVQKREATLETSLAEAKRATEELPELQAKLAILDTRLASEEYARKEHTELTELLAQIEGVDYDPLAHDETRRDLKALTGFQEEKAFLQAALERVDEERANLERLRKNQARWQENLAAELAKKEALAQELTRLPELASQLQRKSTQVNELRDKEAHARQVLGQSKQKLDHCTRLAKDKEQKLSQGNHAAKQKAIYDELRLAFGKNGVQAMIIEIYLPEVEDEANRLLARMTDGRTHVRFETQRQTRKGKAVETLDIKISDELGPRSYELYSGGESFQINLPIRVALSKVRAGRAGANLQTLVIDEGFGTQDAHGRKQLVEAINSISDDFECVLAITHIEELKDAFPVRIDVSKTPQGSQVMIS